MVELPVYIFQSASGKFKSPSNTIFFVESSEFKKESNDELYWSSALGDDRLDTINRIESISIVRISRLLDEVSCLTLCESLKLVAICHLCCHDHFIICEKNFL